MVRRLYCIYDLLAKAPVNGIVQALGTDDEAKRMFRDVIVSDGTFIAKNPEDFGLCYIGEINYDDMIVSPAVLPVRPILLGSDVVRDLRARASLAERVNEVAAAQA